MTITFACPSCGRQIRVKDEAAGKSGKCNDCGSALTVPRRSSAMIARAPDEILAAQPVTTPALPGQAHAVPAPHPQIQYVPVPVPYHAPAPQAAPNITVNVAQHATARADARAVAIANARPAYTNGLATFAAALAVLALLFCWIPFLGILAIPAAGLAIFLAAIALLLALFNRGVGLLRAVGAGVIGFVAIGIAIASTGAATKTIVDEAAKNRQAAQARPQPVEAKRQNPTPPTAPARVAPVEAHSEAPAAAEAQPVADTDPDAAAQKKFSGALSNGRQLANKGIFGPARKQFQRIIDGAPGTEIAAEAQKELDAIAKK
ncbi:MAG TPA: hypothetical protein VEI07_23945 [Planctomycetaceae bacterium]|nr:hypothetical protein [Planctomycetaceae bacterium]